MRLYTDGIFDLFHYGHANYLHRIKKLYPNSILLVGVCTDKAAALYKRVPILNQQERAESVKHCKWVDGVIEQVPWTITADFLAKHQIDGVCHNPGEYPNLITGETDVYAYVKQQGKSIPIQRSPDISTTEIIRRIVNTNGHS